MNEIGDDGASILGDNLKYIYIGNNKIYERGAVELAMNLNKISLLQSLSLRK